jgi:hypothetical protein
MVAVSALAQNIKPQVDLGGGEEFDAFHKADKGLCFTFRISCFLSSRASCLTLRVLRGK